MEFSDLLKTLLNNPEQTQVKIKNSDWKKIKGFAEFRTINFGDDGYFKIVFEDGTFLYILPADELLMYADSAHADFSEIKNEEIGQKEKLIIKGREYVLDNKNDFQYVKRLILGNYQDIEGEVKFSDYIPTDGASELLSLGVLLRTGERADINPAEIGIKDVKITNHLQ